MLVALFLVRCLANIPLASQPLDVRHLFQSEPFLALIDIFAGGATARFSLLALGVYPYVVGRLATWMLCGEVLRELPSSWVERRVYICTALTATAMGSAYLYLMTRLDSASSIGGLQAICDVASLTAATMLFLQLAAVVEGGVEFLVAANSLAALPRYFLYGIDSAGDIAVMILASLVAMFLYVFLRHSHRIVPFVSRAVRRRVRDWLPIGLNTSGVLPLCYLLTAFGAMRLGTFLLAASEVGWIRTLVHLEQQLTDTRAPEFWVMFFILAVPFKMTFEFATFSASDIADALFKELLIIPGLRRRKTTADFLWKSWIRLSWLGPVVMMLSLTGPAFFYYGLHRTGIWPLMLIPLLYTIDPMLGLVHFVKYNVLGHVSLMRSRR